MKSIRGIFFIRKIFKRKNKHTNVIPRVEGVVISLTKFNRKYLQGSLELVFLVRIGSLKNKGLFFLILFFLISAHNHHLSSIQEQEELFNKYTKRLKVVRELKEQQSVEYQGITRHF